MPHLWLSYLLDEGIMNLEILRQETREVAKLLKKLEERVKKLEDEQPSEFYMTPKEREEMEDDLARIAVGY